MDADMAAELTDHLFQQDDEKFGLDLVQYNHLNGYFIFTSGSESRK